MFIGTFDHRCRNWTKDPETNMRYLKNLQNEFNDILHEYGYVFLEDVLDRLGIEYPYNETYGWWLETTELPWECENYISFGIYDVSNKNNRRFVNGLSPNATLNFNVTGDIARYLLDRIVVRNGFEAIDDYFDNPSLFLEEIEWEDYI